LKFTTFGAIRRHEPQKTTVELAFFLQPMRSSSLAKTHEMILFRKWDLTNNHWVFVAVFIKMVCPHRFDDWTHPVLVYAQHWLFSLLVNSLFFFMIKYIKQEPPFLSCHRNHMLTMVGYHEIMRCLRNHKPKNHHVHGVFSPSPKWYEIIWWIPHDFMPVGYSETWFILKSTTFWTNHISRTPNELVYPIFSSYPHEYPMNTLW